MNNTWREKRLEIITLGIFFILVLTSLLFLYSSYSNYTLLLATEEPNKSFIHLVIMFISATVLILSLYIVYSKREYFFEEKKNNTDGLENLFEEIKLSSDTAKIEAFKQMLKEKNHNEIYNLISNMINELQESKKMTDEANKTKTLFLSNMSHEIRTPITGIVGFTNFLTSSNLNEEQREFVNTIRKSSEDLLGVMNNILDVSNIENGKFELNKSAFNFMVEFEKFIDTYALDALEKNIDFTVWMDPELARYSIDSDVGKIKQILTNLISNAIKFTNNHGHVALSIEKLNVSDEKIIVKFMLKDTGIGIDEEQKRSVFNLFNQADNSNTRAYRGVGLGLTIANDLVKMLGGTLSIESELEKGTALSFTLEMSKSEGIKKQTIEPFKVALYSSKEVVKTKSNKHLISYFDSIESLSLEFFKTFVACKDANLDTFDVLYIHYNEIDLEELKRVVAQYSSEKQIILVTKFSNRDKVLEIAPIFSQILYAPITLAKIENSLKIVETNNKLSPLKKDENRFDLKALIVEDNLVNQKVILHTLKGIGVESDVADNGEIGVEMFSKNRYDIVFMDIQMPVMNGVVATKHILEYEKRKNLDHTPIVAVTTNALNGDRELYLSSGMDDYISKPISMHKFVTVIKQFYSTSQVLRKEKISQDKDILLYKKIPTEGKISTTLLTKLDYSVDTAKNREEFYYLMQKNDYKVFLLDKKRAEKEDEVLMNKIINDKIKTIFFMDKKSILTSDDMNQYTKVMYQTSDFSDVQVQLEKMIKL